MAHAMQREEDEQLARSLFAQQAMWAPLVEPGNFASAGATGSPPQQSTRQH